MQRAAEFIWTPDQAIASEWSFREFIGQGPVRRDDGSNRWYLFRKTFSLDQAAERASIEITVDGRYQLFVNNERVGRGPSRCSPYYQRVDQYDVAPLLVAGENVIAVLVHVYGVDTAWYETVKDYWQALFGDGGLYCSCTVHGEAGERVVSSDTSWRCTEARAWNRDTPRSGWGQDFIEDYDARKAVVDWSSVDFDDSGWQQAQVLVDERDANDIAKGFGPVRAFPTLIPREIPHLTERPVAPAAVIASYAVIPDPTLGLDERSYKEQLTTCPAGSITNMHALLSVNEAATVVRTTAENDICILLSFEKLRAGYPFIELDAAGGEIVELAVAETYLGEFDPSADTPPQLSRRSFLDCAHVFRYTAAAGPQRFEKFDWTGIRYLQLTVRNAPEGLKIRHVGTVATHYPVENSGAFECSDNFLNRLWKIARHTVLQCSHDAWEDCPGREKRQWVGDGVARYPVTAAAFGSSITPLDRRFLLQCIESQRVDGLLQMYAPGDHKTSGVVIPDYSLHYLLIAQDYLLHTGDLDTLERVLPGIQKMLDWYERHVGQNGLLVDIPYWQFIEWAHVERRGEAASINALYAAALACAATITTYLGYDRLARRYRGQAEAIRGAINTRLWDSRRGVYADGADPESGELATRVSQQANALLMLFDIAPDDRCGSIIEYIADPERVKLTSVPPVVSARHPFDEQNDVVQCNTFFSHFLYSALAQQGQFDLALQLIRRQFTPMLDTGATTLWESFEPTASLCHAFSATPLFQMSANLLGVRPRTPGFAEFDVAPQFADIGFTAGCYPTPVGNIEVDWKRNDDSVDFKVTVPPSISGTFNPPSNWQVRDGNLQLSPGQNKLVLSKVVINE